MSALDSYYCIVNLPGAPGREICVLDATDDGAAVALLYEVGREWPGFETLHLYRRERFVKAVTNPAWGFV